ncbi:MAG: hypothetical protein KL787_03485 [Taibaiella sp.]|nr:hypothetical protein [Taibaiella sp.]
MQIQEVEGWTEVPKEFTEQFKITNLDSAKNMAKNLINEQIANREPEREKLIGSFQMILTPEGNAYRTTDNVKDTAVWYTAKDNNGKSLIIIDPFVPGKLDIDPRATFTIFEVVHGSGDSMRIQIRQPEEFKTFISFKKNK